MHILRKNRLGGDETDDDSLVKVFPDNGLVEPGGLLELVLLHEEDVRHVQLPRVALVAKLHRFAEKFLNLKSYGNLSVRPPRSRPLKKDALRSYLLILLEVPVDLCLGH